MINGFVYVVYQEDECIFVCLTEAEAKSCIALCNKEYSSFYYSFNRVPVFGNWSKK